MSADLTRLTHTELLSLCEGLKNELAALNEDRIQVKAQLRDAQADHADAVRQLAAAKAENARLQAIVDRLLRVLHFPENGHHVCRWCGETITGGGHHGESCGYVALCEEIGEARAAAEAAKETDDE